MGARGSSFINNIRRRRGTSRIGTATSCPICGQHFSARSTYNIVNSHIDDCLLHSPGLAQNVSLVCMRPIAEIAGLNFDEKCEWLRAQNDSRRVSWQENSLTIVVERQNLLDHSMNQLMHMTTDELHSEFNLVFEGEWAKDAGGVLREWLLQLNSLLLAPETGMYRFAGTENVAYRIHALPSKPPDFYLLHGILIGKALFENVPISCRLCKPLFKSLSGKPLSIDDLQFLDHSIYSTLKFMQTTDISAIVFETFAVTETNETTGKTAVFELKPGGSKTEVSEENKEEYIRLRTEWELEKSAKDTTEKLVEGFCRVIDQQVLAAFEADELELVLCGLPFVDVADWEAFTVYKGEFHAEHQVVRWFWEILEVLSQDQLGMLLQFVMGTTRLPVEGFKTLKTMRGEPARFTLESAPFSRGSPYPRAHTCFNRLDLPLYNTKGELSRNLLYVIVNHATGFGIE